MTEEEEEEEEVDMDTDDEAANDDALENPMDAAGRGCGCCCVFIADAAL